MKPETILRALRRINRNYDALQGPQRRRRARQRARFMGYLYDWAERDLPRARQAERKPRLGSAPPSPGLEPEASRRIT
jgi:hypothetical protein